MWGSFGYEGLVGDCGVDVDTDSSLWHTDIGSCAEACDARSDCKGFTWHEGNSVCIFKKNHLNCDDKPVNADPNTCDDSTSNGYCFYRKKSGNSITFSYTKFSFVDVTVNLYTPKIAEQASG